ncbi:MAG: hydrogenase maturation protease [Candidatus Odinarchaeota archaeon]
MPKSKFLVVLGIGNSIRMDDGAGIRVVEQLSRENCLKNLEIDFKFLNTGGFDILDEINGYHRAIIIDAADMPEKGLKPGDIVHLTNLKEMEVSQTSGVSSHGIGLLHVLKYASAGNYKIPDIIEIHGIQVKETGYFNENLTPEVKAGVDSLVEEMKIHILGLFSRLHD